MRLNQTRLQEQQMAIAAKEKEAEEYRQWQDKLAREARDEQRRADVLRGQMMFKEAQIKARSEVELRKLEKSVFEKESLIQMLGMQYNKNIEGLELKTEDLKQALDDMTLASITEYEAAQQAAQSALELAIGDIASEQKSALGRLVKGAIMPTKGTGPLPLPGGAGALVEGAKMIGESLVGWLQLEDVVPQELLVTGLSPELREAEALMASVADQMANSLAQFSLDTGAGSGTIKDHFTDMMKKGLLAAGARNRNEPEDVVLAREKEFEKSIAEARRTLPDSVLEAAFDVMGAAGSSTAGTKLLGEEMGASRAVSRQVAETFRLLEETKGVFRKITRNPNSQVKMLNPKDMVSDGGLDRPLQLLVKQIMSEAVDEKQLREGLQAYGISPKMAQDLVTKALGAEMFGDFVDPREIEARMNEMIREQARQQIEAEQLQRAADVEAMSQMGMLLMDEYGGINNEQVLEEVE
jgi:hypothetical protein